MISSAATAPPTASSSSPSLCRFIAFNSMHKSLHSVSLSHSISKFNFLLWSTNKSLFHILAIFAFFYCSSTLLCAHLIVNMWWWWWCCLPCLAFLVFYFLYLLYRRPSGIVHIHLNDWIAGSEASRAKPRRSTLWSCVGIEWYGLYQ